MNVNSTNNASSNSWWDNGSTGFLERQRELGTHGRFTPGANQASTSPGFQSRLTNARSAAEGLRTATRDMQTATRGADNAFDARVPTSSDTDIMTIRDFDANRLRTTNTSNMSVEVHQVATAQRNEGTALSGTALATSSGFSAGSNQITIGVGDQNFNLNVNISATDTVRDVQNRIASAINNRSDIAVRASVTTDNGNTRLTLESAQTGVATTGQPNFTVSGAAANAAGITGVTQAAQNAEFRVNRGNFTGAMQTSRTNDVELVSGINARLADTGTVNITMERDETAQINAFRNLVNQFNDLVELSRDNPNSRNGDRLARDLATFATTNAPALGRAGISMNRDGFLSINESQMRTAAERGELERLAGGSALGRLERIADNVIRNPAGFVNSTNEPGEGLDFNPFQANRLNNMINVGMLFDSWF